jgi:uncharacterized NAD-dependent epimerase/dehydratase family protein
LTLRAGKLAGDVGEQLGALHIAERSIELAVRGGKVVVPEERHLLLQWPPRMDHAEQPALTRIFDVRVRLETSGAIEDGDVRRVPDIRVNVVGLIRVGTVQSFGLPATMRQVQ